eukprot:CAMPEP_0179055914 /NCGR_PEP_ID=MMETSP0796-20121207/23544_1 /TAXON_ID=73915 /ORGANISM="Pyrodinium bahamense, Strain pbaha01" /LENGTH=278 /DNA_ID=CAMNT_0020752577 /DNA_START=97 /DNA_END=932 /DNA_ORIENTATION=-
MASKALKAVSPVACMAEYSAMALFVVFGCGSAMGIDGSRCAWRGTAAPMQGLANFVAQMLGSVTGAVLLCLLYPAARDKTSSLGSNGVGEGWAWYNALAGEVLGTFFLVTVVLQTACSPKSSASRAQAAVAIGLAVFVAHVVLVPVDGCSINPTRSFGPALVAGVRYGKAAELFADMWIFWVGPLAGAMLAALHYRVMERISPASAGNVSPEAAKASASAVRSLHEAAKATAELPPSEWGPCDAVGADAERGLGEAPAAWQKCCAMWSTTFQRLGGSQ